MDPYFLLVLLLMSLATLDLIVGVANDAVNFLNSALGTRAGSMRVILAVASFGVVLGTLFSSGMMEVARKGVFDPGYFTFHSLMLHPHTEGRAVTSLIYTFTVPVDYR